MNISYEAYRVFYYTAKTRSFTQAANALGNSQPNITRIIKNLERELGCTLFLRNNRHVELTAEGETLYRHVSAAFEQLQAGEEALLRGRRAGRRHSADCGDGDRAACLPASGTVPISGALPGVHIRLFNGSTPAAIDELKNGLADLAFVTSPIDMTDKLRSTPLTDVQETAVCGSAYRSLTGSPVTLEALAEYPMISLGADGSAYRLYRQFFAENHVPFEPDIEAATADQILPDGESKSGDRLCSGVLPVGGGLGAFHIPDRPDGNRPAAKGLHGGIHPAPCRRGCKGAEKHLSGAGKSVSKSVHPKSYNAAARSSKGNRAAAFFDG